VTDPIRERGDAESWPRKLMTWFYPNRGWAPARNRIMPFDNHGNRSFTLTSIDKNAPAASGVFGLSNARQWLYIGETANIHAELIRQFQSPDPFLREHPPTGFTFELSPAAHRVDRQNQLVTELSPLGNRRAGHSSNRSSYARA
jgi:hypothetical protein